jgi:hypothetical protein
MMEELQPTALPIECSSATTISSRICRAVLTASSPAFFDGCVGTKLVVLKVYVQKTRFIVIDRNRMRALASVAR